jgi:hypothetical protein
MPHILSAGTIHMLPHARRPRITRAGDAVNAGTGAAVTLKRRGDSAEKREPPQRRGDSQERR